MEEEKIKIRQTVVVDGKELSHPALDFPITFGEEEEGE